MSGKPFSVSVILTCFNEESTIEPFVRRLAETLRKGGRPFEIVMVNDGSTDRTQAVLEPLQDAVPEIGTLIELRGNFGQVAALTCAVQHARNEALLFIDTDFQYKPEDAKDLVARYEEGFDFVTGRRRKRNDALARRLASWVANFLLRRMAKLPVSDIGCTFKIVHRDLIFAGGCDERRELSFVRALRFAGRIAEIDVAHAARPVGRSGWGVWSLSRFLFRALFVHGDGAPARLAGATLGAGANSGADLYSVGGIRRRNGGH